MAKHVFMVEVNSDRAYGTAIVEASNAKELEEEIRSELKKWRVKVSNTGINRATKKAMKLGKAKIVNAANIVRLCNVCYGMGVDYETGEVCEKCEGTGQALIAQRIEQAPPKR